MVDVAEKMEMCEKKSELKNITYKVSDNQTNEKKFRKNEK